LNMCKAYTDGSLSVLRELRARVYKNTD
jgi:hypothetical protein